ncbi:MAG: hypothetical protein IT204_02790, partial [Fimbriimonadaceae bacterium]|nr:hypothetical protein [Fimbriimonadaceae bacterium]
MAELHWTLARAAAAVGLAGPFDALPLRAIVTDSRQVGPGDLFVALRGERHDGHRFVAAAVAAGAAAVLVSAAVDAGDAAVLQVPDTLLAYGDLARFRRDRWDGLVVGVTGSVGKSSAKELIADVLEQAQPTARSQK